MREEVCGEITCNIDQSELDRKLKFANELTSTWLLAMPKIDTHYVGCKLSFAKVIKTFANAEAQVD